MTSPFSITFEKGADRDLKRLPPPVGRLIASEIQKYLAAKPYEVWKTRIKKLHHFKLPLYRLRVGDYRVYYRIKFNEVAILAVLHKKESDR